MVWSSDASRAIALPGVEVVNDAHRAQPDIEVRHHDPDETQPCELHVTGIEPGRLLPGAERDARLAAVGHAVLAAADEMAERVTAERVARDQHDVDRQDDAADADAGAAFLEERLERVL